MTQNNPPLSLPLLLSRAPPTQLLPTELLLEIFSRVAYLHPDPSTLYKLTAINHEWRSIFKTYGETLWRIATLSAFPGAYFPCPGTEVLFSLSTMDMEGEGYWRETFLIHCGWVTRRAYTTVVVAPGPTPVELSSSSWLLSSPGSGLQATTAVGEHEVQDTVAVDSAVIGSVSAPVVVVSIQEATALLVHAAAATGSSSTTQDHYHQHHHYHHQHHHVHDHHLLMDQHHQQQQFLDSMHRESSSTTNIHSHDQHQQQHTCTINPPRISLPSPPPPPALLLPTDGNETEILSCSLCTYSDICLIPQAKICVRTYRTHAGGPLMQVLDWSMRHSVDLGPRRRGNRDDDEAEEEEEDAEDDSDEASNGEMTEVGMEVEVEVEVEEGHQDLISGMAVNETGTLLVSCSIDGTVRVWDVLVVEFGDLLLPGRHDLKGKEKGTDDSAAVADIGFLEKVEKYGCPVRARRVLSGHVGWVNSVAIEDTTVVSGGSDHTVRIWDALTGNLLRLIPDLFTTRDLDLGVFTVAIHKTNTDTIVGVGSVIEGYQLYSLSTGELLMDLDEPLTSRQHNDFETEVYQQYAAKIEISETVVVTNSKLRGMLCVWCRWTGELLYRMRVCPSPLSFPSSYSPSGQGEQEKRRRQGSSKRSKKMTKMVSFGLGESSRISSRPRRVQDEDDDEEEEETVHTFKANKSGSMLMCTLCDGRVALFEFGSQRSRREATAEKEEDGVVVLRNPCESRFGLRIGGAIVGEAGEQQQQQQQQQVEQNQAQVGGHQQISSETVSVAAVQGEDEEEVDFACNGGSLAWIWSRNRRLGVTQQHQQRVILV